MQLRVLSDAICPWCYIGRQHMLAALAMLEGEGLRFTVSWRPYQLNPDMPAAGLPRDEYRRAKFGSLARSRELDAQVASAAAAAGLAINHSRMLRTPNTVDAHRLAALAEGQGHGDAVVARLFQDYFVDGRDIGSPAVLADAAAAAGMDRAEVAAFLAGDAGRAEVLAEDAALRQAGVRGVPTFVLGNRVLFSGAVPADTFAEALSRAARLHAAQAAAS